MNKSFHRQPKFGVSTPNLKFYLSLILYISVICTWIIASRPGNMSPDSLESFRQIYKGGYDDFHPLAYTFFVGVTSLWGTFPVGVIIVQSVLMSLSIYLLLGRLLMKSTKTTVIFLSSVLYSTPFVGNFATTVWKDVPYSTLTIIGLVLLSSSFSTSPNPRGVLHPSWILGVVSISLGSTFRHEGFISGLVYLVTALLLLWIFAKNKLKISQVALPALSVVTGLILGLVFQNLLVSAVDARPAPSDNSLSSFVHDLAYANEVNPTLMPPNAKKLVDSIVSGDASTAALNCTNGALLFEKEGFDALQLRVNAGQIPINWLRTLFSSAGGNLIKARHCRASTFLPFPIALPPESYVWGYFGIDANPYGLQNSVDEGRMPNFTKKLRDFTVSWLQHWNDVGRLIAWPGLHTTFIIVILLFFRRFLRIEDSIALLLLSLVIGRTLILIAVSNGPWYRLGLPIHLISISLFLVLVFRLVQIARLEFKKL